MRKGGLSRVVMRQPERDQKMGEEEGHRDDVIITGGAHN